MKALNYSLTRTFYLDLLWYWYQKLQMFKGHKKKNIRIMMLISFILQFHPLRHVTGFHRSHHKCPNFQSIWRLHLRVVHVLRFIVLHLCTGHYAGFFHVNIINSQFVDYFLKQMNLQEIFLHTYIMYLKASTDVKISTFWWKVTNWGMRLWIMKWTFKKKYKQLLERKQTTTRLNEDNLLWPTFKSCNSKES